MAEIKYSRTDNIDKVPLVDGQITIVTVGNNKFDTYVDKIDSTGNVIRLKSGNSISISDVYSPTSIDAMSGIAVASAIDEVNTSLSDLATNVDVKLESEEATDFKDASTPEFQKKINDYEEEVSQLSESIVENYSELKEDLVKTIGFKVDNLADIDSFTHNDSANVNVIGNSIKVSCNYAWAWVHAKLVVDVKPNTEYWIMINATFSNPTNQRIILSVQNGTDIQISKDKKITTPSDCTKLSFLVYSAYSNEGSIGDSIIIDNLQVIEHQSVDTRLSRLDNRKFLFIGDSYGVGYNPDNTSSRSWCDIVIDYCGLTRGVNAYKSCASGYGFANSNGKFVSLLKSAYYNIVEHPFDITDIFVCGGVNDTTTTSTESIEEELYIFSVDALDMFPNAIVHVGMIGGSRNLSIKNDFGRVVNAYRKSNCYKNMTYIANSQYILCDKTMLSSDGTHPSDEGYRELGIYLSEYIKGNGIDVLKKKTIGTIIGNMDWQQHNEFETIRMESSFAPSSTTLTTNTWYTGFYLDSAPFNGYGENIYSEGYLKVLQQGGITYSYPMTFRLTDSAFEYMFRDEENKTIDNVYEIDIFISYLTLPSMQF